MNEQDIKEVSPEKKSYRRVLIILTVTVVALLGAGGVGLAYIDSSYSDRVYPGIYVGKISVSGMHQKELETFLGNMNEKLATEGIHFTFQNDTGERKYTLFPVVVSESTTQELMNIDEHKEAERLIRIGKEGYLPGRIMSYARGFWSQRQAPLKNIFVDEAGIKKILEEETKLEVKAPQDANITIESRSPLEVKIIPEQKGVVYDFSLVKSQLLKAWSRLSVPEITLKSQSQNPAIMQSEIGDIKKDVETVFVGEPIQFVFSGEGEEKHWNIKPETLEQWIGVREYENGSIGLGVKTENVKKYLDLNIAPEVNVEAEDARFHISADGKVEEFQGSKNGVKLNEDATLASLNQLIRSRVLGDGSVSSTVQLSVVVAEPEIKTGDVNDLGISSVLGVGVSNFKGSPANRVHNITAAVKKLNGILIKPGEEFSAIDYTQPYTIEAGYLPEKVIKGDKIIPEIGGGLCQVGTTLFRMAMNSGMDITERRNHSLVVSYYNDLSNGLPGTDATIYDPAPDFKFKNDTTGYVLIQTSVNPATGDLRFTLWGTKDGRKGYYTKPVVSNWISPGPTRIIETANLKPGQKECQGAFRGANASFTYIREMPDGTKQSRVFESHYRALPQICLVGADPTAPKPCEGENCPVVPPASESPTPAVVPAEAVIPAPVNS